MLTERKSKEKIKCSECDQDAEFNKIQWITTLPTTAVYYCDCGNKMSNNRISEIISKFIQIASDPEGLKDFIINELGQEWKEI